MPLSSVFKQREFGAAYGSIRGRIIMRTPSGPQWGESMLETELLEQLRFSSKVADVITQPIIEYVIDGKARTYTPDALIQLHAGTPFETTYYLVEVKREADLKARRVELAPKFAAARGWCRANAAEFRIMTDTKIRTEYLKNVRALFPYLGEDPEIDALEAIWAGTNGRSVAVKALLEQLIAAGMPAMAARGAVNRAVANKLVRCDLTTPFTDASLLSEVTYDSIFNHDEDPILRLIRTAESE